MADIIVSGNSSGSVTLRAPDVSGTTILTLPTTSGTLVTTAGGSTVPFALGSAAAPSITFTGDTNTGIYSPAADTIAFTEGGVESMRIDASGNVGIGTSSPAQKLDVNGAVKSTGFYIGTTGTSGFVALGTTGSATDGGNFVGRSATSTFNAGGVEVYAGGAERMRITSTGNVGIGTSTPGARLTVSGDVSVADATNGTLVFENRSATNNIQSGDATFASWKTLGINSGLTTFSVIGSERMRITADGSLLIGTTTGFTSLGFTIDNQGRTWAGISGGQNTFHVWSTSSSTYRFYVNENGGVNNFSGNNVNLSDERTKKNIEVAGSYLDKICSIPVKLFNYKHEAEGEQRTLGVIAQDVESVAPEFVNSTDGWEGTEPKDGIPLKTIYSTDLMFGMMKAIQEQQALITQLQADVAALKGAK